MHIIKDKDQYFSLIQDFQYIPFTQSEGWHDFHVCLKPESISFFVDNTDSPAIACFGHIKRFLGLRMLLIEGECYKKIDSHPNLLQQFYTDIRQLGFDIIEINSSAKYNAGFEMGIRRSAYLRPVGQFSVPLTIWVDLKEEVIFDRNWKRNIKKANESGLKFEVIDRPDKDDIERFVSIYNAMSEFKGFQHYLGEKQIGTLLMDSQMLLFRVVDKSRRVLSMRILHRHNDIATDVYAANSLDGRESGATHFMISSILVFLKEKSLCTFDFSRVLYDDGPLNNVAQFKNGVKGVHVIYNGEWSWYKYPIYRPLMYLVKRFLMKKREV